MHGKLWPRFPYFILYVSQPIAEASSWCPKQIPNIGFVRGLSKTFLMFSTVLRHTSGSPGPLLRNRPSYSFWLSLWSQGTTSTRAPRARKQRIWLSFKPQSTTQMRGVPVALYVIGFLTETSATRLRRVWSTKFSESSGSVGTPCWIRPGAVKKNQIKLCLGSTKLKLSNTSID